MSSSSPANTEKARERGGSEATVLLRSELQQRYPDVATALARRRLLKLRQRESRWNWVALCVSTFALASLLLLSKQAGAAAAGAIPFDEVRSGSLFFRTAPGVLEPAPRLETSMDVAVSGMVARVSVLQRFHNAGTDWVEGVYVFPLPDDAAVDRLLMRIGERLVEGEIREREQARKRYQQARSAGRRASLVEQERPNMFTTSVANIGPGDAIEIEIGYLETLRYDNEELRLRLPLTVTPRFIAGTPMSAAAGVRKTSVPGWSPATDQVADAARITPVMYHPDRGAANPVDIHISIDAGLPLAWVDSRYHEVRMKWQGTRYDIELADSAVPTDRDFELVWRPATGAAPAVSLFTERLGGEDYALLVFMPPQRYGDFPEPSSREIVFVIDTSGSMGGASMRQARAALQLALGRLSDADRFNIIQFNSHTSSLFPGPVDATGDNLAYASVRVERLSADGGTVMAPALQAALADPGSGSHLRQVVFITDGSVGNEEALFGIIQNGLGRSRLFTVGIGSAPNAHFMRKAAQFGRGTFTYIGEEYEVEEKMDALFRKLESPVLTDVEVQWPGSVPAEVWPERVPDLYAGEPVVLTARLSRAEGTISVSGASGDGHWLRQLYLDGGRHHPGVAALWARNKIAALLDRKAAGVDAGTIRREVVAVALAHQLVSPYTSLVAVDRTPVRPSTADLRASAVPNLLPKGSRMGGALAGFPKTATPATQHIVTGLLMLLAALCVALAMRRERRE